MVDVTAIMFCIQDEAIQGAEAANVDIVGGVELVDKVIPYMGIQLVDDVMVDNRKES